jgi:choline kinase
MRSSTSRYTVPAKRVAPGTGNNRLSVVITSANMGKRMKSYGPKALFALGNQTIIDRQVRTIWNVFPNADIFVVVGFEAEKIREQIKSKYPIRLIYNSLWNDTNVVYSLSMALHACTTDCVLILHGDLVFNEEAIRGITNTKSRALVDIANSFKADEVGLVFNDHDKIITNFSYGLPTKWAQIIYLEGIEKSILEKISHDHEMSEKWFLYEALNYVIAQGGKFHVHQPIGLKIVEVDTIKDLERARKI